MRNMSFMLTTEQIRNRTKTVTRRLGWSFLKPGDLIQAVEKGQGLKKGEKVNRLAVLRVVKVSGEWMSDFPERDDAHDETRREGFAHMTPEEFRAFFYTSHGQPSAEEMRVTRIEFEYVS